MGNDEELIVQVKAMLIRLARMQQELKGRMNDGRAEAYASRSLGRRHGLLAKVNAFGDIREQLEYIFRRHRKLLVNHFGTADLVEIAGLEITKTKHKQQTPCPPLTQHDQPIP